MGGLSSHFSGDHPTIAIPMRRMEAIFDALHARRWLSARALEHPNELTETIKEYLRPSRSQPRTRRQLERLAAALISSNLIDTDHPTLLHEDDTHE